jgi:acyl carrier protein
MKEIEKLVHQHIYRLSSDNKKGVKIDNNMLLKEDIGFDSMSQVALFTNLTDELKLDLLQFNDEELIGLKRVQDLITLFSKKQLLAAGNI